MAKVSPADAVEADSLEYRTFEGPFKKPIPCGNESLTTYHPGYLQRKKDVGEEFFTCKNGRKLCYFTDGASDPSKEHIPVVLCLHSAGCQKYLWLQEEPFTDIFQICVDRPGHGGSSNPPEDTIYSFADEVHEMVEVVDAVYSKFKIPIDKKFFVVGHSMGATVAIEMAACPESSHRIAAIAPVSGPADVRNPCLTKKEVKRAIAGFMMQSENYSCCSGGSLARYLNNLGAEMMTRPVAPGEDPKTYEAFKSFMRGPGDGDERAWDVVWANPFFVTQIIDTHIPGPHRKFDYISQFRRCFGMPWSFDPANVKVPCFIYSGKKEETPLGHAEISHKLIKDSELISWEAYGHMSMVMEHRRIIQALVKKQKVQGPPLWEQGAEAA